jgi:small subunit ribosomal protein S20
MANHLATKKQIRKTIKENLVNTRRRRKVKEAMKKFSHILENSKSTGNILPAQAAFKVVQSKVMHGVTKNVMSLNKASRLISSLSAKVKSLKTSL